MKRETIRLAITLITMSSLCSVILAQQSWTSQVSGVTTSLNSIKAVNSTVAWACGDGGTLLRTTDGGTTWSKLVSLSEPTLNLYSIDAVDANRAWVTAVDASFTTSYLFHTSNGGSSWTLRVSSTTSGTFYNAVRMYSATNGVMMGDPENGSFTIFTTTDGTTWTRTSSTSIPSPLSNEFGLVNHLTISGNGAWFGTQTRMFRSTDRGRNWMVSTPSGSLGGFATSSSFANDQVGLALGQNGSVVFTTDGGSSWGATISTGLLGGSGITHVTSSVVIAVGSGGASTLSTDGGRTWALKSTPTTSRLNAVSFSSPAAGWSVGNSGTILKWSGGALGELTEIEPNNEAGQAMALSYGDSLNASINPAGDIDYYRLSAVAGDTVEVYAYNVNNSLLDGFLQLYSGIGSLLDFSNDFFGSSRSRIVFLPQNSGTYYLRYTAAGTGGSFPNEAPGEPAVSPQLAVKGHNVVRTGTIVPEIDQPIGIRNGLMSTSDGDPTGDYRLRVRRYVAGAPFAAPGFVTNLYANSAEVWPLVNPNGHLTTVSIQYGTTTAYGSEAKWGSYNDIVSYYFPTAIAGLAANTTYHYRVVATNAAGTSVSADDVFTTPPNAVGWTRQQSGTDEVLLGVAFVDANVGTAVGTSGTILRTTNGGTTWNSQTSGVTTHLRAVHFSNANTGTVVGDGGTILRTTNGGSTWTGQSAPPNNLFGVFFTDINNGIAVGAGGAIHRTTNGGAQWFGATSGTTNTLRGVHFTGTNTGIIVGLGGIILRTTNAGSTWTSQTSGTLTNLRGVFLASATVGIAVTGVGDVLRTTNGGTAWSNISTGTSNLLYGVSFSDANTGTVVGDMGTILRTTNGGLTWVPQVSGTYNAVTAVSSTAGGTIVVGDFGMILNSKETVTAPTTTTNSATSLSSSSATLNGSVNPNSSATSAWFEWGTSNTLATSTSTTVQSLGSGAGAVSYSVTLSGLSAGTTYYYRAAAQNSGGTQRGAIVSFQTTTVNAPAVTTVAASSVTINSATLNGSINPNGLSTTAFFQWGTNSALSSSTSTASQSIGSGSSAVSVTASLTGLTAGTTYYYRAVGQSSAGTQQGSILSFATTSATAGIALSTNAISFGTVVTGSSSSQTFSVSNPGSATLTVSSVSSSNAAFSVSPSSFSVAAGGSAQTVTVTFSPSGAGSQTGTITLSHNAGGTSTVSVSGTGNGRVTSLATSTGRFSAGIPPAAWVLMSLPYELDNKAASVLSGQISGSTPWKMYAYGGGNYQDISNASDALQPVRGFWFKTVEKTSPFLLSFGSGNITATSGTYQITLPTGWSLVGPPFYNNEVSWSPVNTTPGASGIRVWKYAHESSSWSGPLNPSTERMKPFGGYAVYNGTGATATLTLSRGPVTSGSIREWEDGDGWYVLLDVGAAPLRIGGHRKALMGTDPYDYPMAPSPPENNAMAPYLAGNLWSDIRSTDDHAVAKWRVFVDPATTRSFTVKEMSGIPAGWEVVAYGIPGLGMVKLEAGMVCDLPNALSTPFTMVVAAGPHATLEEEMQPTSFALSQNYPNPFNPTTTITYQLASEGFVSLKIFDVMGKEVRTLVQGHQKPGTFEVRWDGKDSEDHHVPSGMYVSVLKTGTIEQAMKMLLVR